MQTRFAMQRIGRAGLTTLALILLAGCGGMAGSATTDAICRELRADLPTYSERDTPETLAAGGRFVGVFEAVCG